MQEGEQPEQPHEPNTNGDLGSAGSPPGWQYKAEENPPHDMGGVPAANVNRPVIESVEWTASEYIAHQKTPGWFVMLGLAIAAMALLIYFITGGDVVSPIMIVIVGAVFGVFAARQPRVLHYSVSDSGVKIGEKYYGYGEFKSFAVMEEGAIDSILFLPLKRFMPPISIYFAPEDEHKIVSVLSSHLPIEQREQDPIERLMRKLRF